MLNYNGGAHVLRCVEHILGLDWPEEALDVVVVDNDSTDGSVEAITDLYERVRVIQTGVNLGFPANNRALTELDECDYVGLVNNDAFVAADWLQHLVHELETDPSVGAVCPKITFEPRFVDVRVRSDVFEPGGADPRVLGVRVSGIEVDGSDVWRRCHFADGFWGLETGTEMETTFQWTDGNAVLRVPSRGEGGGGRAALRLAGHPGTTVQVSAGDETVECVIGDEPLWAEIDLSGPCYDVINNVGSVLIDGGFGADRGYLEPDNGQYDHPEDVFNWCGAGVLFRPEYLADVGLFDERFFMYYEDTDLSWRGRSRGWVHRYVPTSSMRHIHAATSVEGSAMFAHYVERNRLAMLAKNAPLVLVCRALVGFFVETVLVARREVVLPLLRLGRPHPTNTLRRARSLAAFLRMLPSIVPSRLAIRRRSLVPDDELLAWQVER